MSPLKVAGTTPITIINPQNGNQTFVGEGIAERWTINDLKDGTGCGLGTLQDFESVNKLLKWADELRKKEQSLPQLAY
jgi:hypothetical protein